MLTIYTDKISERLTYTLSVIFDDRKIGYRLVNDAKAFKDAPLPKLVYSESSIFTEEVHIYSSTLLFEDQILKHIIAKSEWNTHEVLSFGGIPDILASIFYVVS